ncbi:SusD/RagB family nutrient-binding outer membrane lipoprotein [Flaviaesturariibacter amylovorans]|uniref:SusD/RagB family nutrient-binding outer membrane lipoprotein n=1 Tax=Flaviaesturariibacter amylovorans TaxID=1084520 RepID=A0ABP8HSL9_9BACT
MKKISIILLAFAALAGTGCKKYLDINQPPNGPASADPALYLASIQANYALGVQFDARALGTITQNWANSSTGNTFSPFEQHGFIPNSDAGGELWRNVYWKGGQNTVDMIRLARQQEKWDMVGIGLALQAWGWQNLTDLHGEIIVSEAFKNQNTFRYDTQDSVYATVKRLALEAIDNLNRTDGNIGHPLLAKFDLMYRGNRLRWKRFAYGILAQNALHLQKKSNYSAADVIRYVDSSFTSNAEDALVPFLGLASADANFFGPLRANLASFGQSGFIVRLMDGTALGGAPVDPRRPVMLVPSGDGTYRGLNPYTTQASNTSTTAVRNVWGSNMGVTPTPSTFPGKYLFADKAPLPLMTYAMLQFIKAEAALTVDPAVALDAYKKGINAHLDFVQQGTTATGANANGTGSYTFGTIPATFAAERTAYLANTKVVPATPAELTRTMILLQKYIALWGYGFMETWVDLRKVDYSNTVYTSLTMPTSYYISNGGKPAYRLRPRYNSEYLTNVGALAEVGALDQDYHTRKMWIQLP